VSEPGNELVQATVVADVTEAEETQALLTAAGIESELQQEPEADAIAVLVPEGSLEAALDAIEALTEPDELTAEP
jgi:type III secretory pathway lipoprotein EscJ